MPDSYNFKLRTKFLRPDTLTNTPINPGNLLIDMSTGKAYLDILDASNTLQRICLNMSGQIDNVYTKLEIDNALESLIQQLDNEDPED